MSPAQGMPFTAILAFLVLLFGCSGSGDKAAEPRSRRPPPGEEPLETASILEDDVIPLAPERHDNPPPSGRPCAWSRAWAEPGAPKPLLAGVGAVPNPTRRAEEPIRLPYRERMPRGEMIVELVVGPDGRVREASVVRSSDPRWPEAEQSIVDSVRQWTYEPAEVDGTTVAICTTVIVGL